MIRRILPSEVTRKEVIDYLCKFGGGAYARHFCEIHSFDYEKLVRESVEDRHHLRQNDLKVVRREWEKFADGYEVGVEH